MQADDSGVAGFFEDLPVLMFVLGGVSVLILTGAWVAMCEQRARATQELEDVAQELAERLLDQIGAVDPSLPPMIATVEGVRPENVSDELLGSLQASVSVVKLYPEVGWVFTWSSADGTSAILSTGAHVALFNVRMNDGSVGIAELRVVVWQA
jgi:hypothetical protein